MKTISTVIKHAFILALPVAALACNETSTKNTDVNTVDREKTEIVLKCSGRTQRQSRSTGSLPESSDSEMPNVYYKINTASQSVAQWDAAAGEFKSFCQPKDAQDETVTCQSTLDESVFRFSSETGIKSALSDDITVTAISDYVTIDRLTGAFRHSSNVDIVSLSLGEIGKSRSTSTGTCEEGRPTIETPKF